MPETVIISYRGAKYAIGQGQLYYGIWPATSPQGQPIEWWQHTPEGWTAAWARFTAVEVPGTIAPVSAPGAGQPAGAATFAAPAAGGAAVTGAAVTGAAVTGAAMTGADVTGAAVASAAVPAAAVPAAAVTGAPVTSNFPARIAQPATSTRNSRIGAALLGLGVVLGLAGLFPAYLGGASLASSAADLVPHAIYLAAWSLCAALILTGGFRRQVGALIGLGVSVVTLGLFLADAGTAISGGAHLMGTGLVLGIAGWAACSAGTVLALRACLSVREALALRGSAAASPAPAGYGQRPRRPSRFSAHEVVPMATLMLAALGAAIAFAPSWDSFTLQATSGAAQTITEGNAFASPGAVIAGDLLVMAGFVAVIVVAALWRPIRLGAALAAGAVIPLAAQAISAIVQIRTPATPAQFGISPAQASAAGLTISSGLTAMFWVYCAFLATIALLGIWMVLAPGSASASPSAGSPQYWTQPAWAASGAVPVGAAPAGAVPAAAVPAAAVPASSDPIGLGPAGLGPAGLDPAGPAVPPAQAEIVPGLRPAP